VSCFGVRLVSIVRSASVNYKFNQWFGRQCCRSGSMDISATPILSYYL